MKGHVMRRCPRPLAEACETGRCAHKWAYTFSTGADPTTGKRRQYTGGGYRTKRDAETACRTAIAKAEAGTLLSRADERRRVAAERLAAESRPTVAQYLRTWLTKKTDVRPNTLDGYRCHVEEHIIPAIGERLLDELTVGHVRELLKSLAEPAPKRVRQVVVIQPRCLAAKTDGTPCKRFAAVGTEVCPSHAGVILGRGRGASRSEPSTPGLPGNAAAVRVRTRATLMRIRATLTSALNDAVLDELIVRNPAMRVPIPDNAAAGGREMTVWTPEQLGRFLRTAMQDRLGSMFFLGSFTGMRRGELVGLRWDDVDFDTSQVRVRHSITQRSGAVRHGKPKTKGSERTVALDPRTVDVLRKHRKRQSEERLRLGEAWQDTLGLVFTSEDGDILRPDAVSKVFGALSKAAHVPAIRLHDLRHTHATHALAAGERIEVVSARLGHSSVAITQQIYTHVLPLVASDAAVRIAGLVSDAALRAESGAAEVGR